MPLTSIAAILGRLPSGIFVLTVREGERETGMICSWVMQAGFDPPMITVAVNHDRYVEDWISSGQPFVLNILADSQRSLLRHFARGFEPGEPAFEELEVKRSPLNVPILGAAMGYLECVKVSHVDSPDHRIFLAEVKTGRLAEDAEPMVHIRKNGLRY